MRAGCYQLDKPILTDHYLRIKNKIARHQAIRAQDDAIVPRFPTDNMQAHLPVHPVLLLRPSVQHNFTAGELKLPSVLGRHIDFKPV